MGDKIKPGAMGLIGGGGMPSAFSDSMAARIESELNLILPFEGYDTFETGVNSTEARDRRMLFVAIAQGIVKHIADNKAAVHLKLSRDGSGRVTDVQVVIKITDMPDIVINSE